MSADRYGFALGMHCKDMDNAMLAIRDKGEGDASSIASPMLELAQNLMHQVIPLPHPLPHHQFQLLMYQSS